MVVQEQMVDAKVGSAHVPVEVFGLEIKCEHVGKQLVECASNILHRFGLDVRGGIEGSLLA
jgi:hypothetical protein